MAHPAILGRDRFVHHLIIDLDGSEAWAVPEEEESHHSGTLRGYTAFKDLICGSEGPPWWWMIGVEIFQTDELGTISPATWDGLRAA